MYVRAKTALLAIVAAMSLLAGLSQALVLSKNALTLLEANLTPDKLEEYKGVLAKLDDWECACPFTCKELDQWKGEYAPNRLRINFMKDGTEGEQSASTGLSWFCAMLSFFMCGWYIYQYMNATCGWEVLFVSFVEAIYYVADIFFMDKVPFTLFIADGATANMVRYMEWLLTCPVLLIHLSNITGLSDEYSPRTMTVLTSDQGTLLFGAVSAMSSGGLKIFFFIIGSFFGVSTFYSAAQIYIEAYHMVPEGAPQRAVRYMTWTYFMSWPVFPIFFLAGPAAFGHLSKHGDQIAHSVNDLLSKNLWGFLGWYLRYTIHVHVAVNGHHTKRVRTTIMGKETEITVFAKEDDADAVTHSTRALTTRRKSIERLARQLRAKGQKTRNSIDLDNDSEAGWKNTGKRIANTFRGAQGPNLPEKALVVVASSDADMGNFFVKELSKLKSQIQVEIVANEDEMQQCLDYFRQNGPRVTLVLVQPTLASSSPRILTTIKSFNAPSVLFSATSDLRSNLGADDYIHGPQFGQPFDSAVLGSLIAQYGRNH